MAVALALGSRCAWGLAGSLWRGLEGPSLPPALASRAAAEAGRPAAAAVSAAPQEEETPKGNSLRVELEVTLKDLYLGGHFKARTLL